MSRLDFSRCLTKLRQAGASVIAGGLLLGAVPTVAMSADLITLFMEGFAGTGDDRFTSTFVVSGPGTKRVMAFAFTPADAANGLADPKLTVVDANGIVGSNDNWPNSPDADEIANIIQASGLDINERAAAFIVSLPAGNYRSIVQGANGGTGLAAAGVIDMEDDHRGGGDPSTGVCAGQEVELPLVNTGAIPGAKGKVRVRTYADCAQDLRVEIEDVPLGDYGLRVAGQFVGTITVVNTGVENEGQIEFDDEANDPHELPLTFDPSGLMEVTQGSTVILRLDFPSL